MTDKNRYPVLASVAKRSAIYTALVLANSAYAQDAADTSKGARIEDEVIVTGTLIRGSAPVGTNVIGLDPQKVQATGAISATELLQSVPQNGQFNKVQFATGASTNITINRPSLRDIPGGNSGGSPTLVLFDGRRIVGMGVASTTADPDIVPPALIERVEIVPDGGSALYGSDAVAGVINFVTRKEFEGVEIEARAGNADSYDEFDGSITAGHGWGDGRGNAYISYNHAENDALNGDDLGWFRMYPQSGTSLGLPPGETVLATQCNPGNVRVSTSLVTPPPIFGLPYGPTAGGTTNLPTAGSPNSCDLTKDFDLYPEVERDSVMLGLNQELSDTIHLEVRGYYMDREITATGPQNFSTINTFFVDLPQYNILDTPYYEDHKTGTPGETVHFVDVLFGPARVQQIDLETWGVYPTLTVDLPKAWQLRLQGSYGESETENISPGADFLTLKSGVQSGLFNPYDIGASNQEAIGVISNFGAYGFTEQTLWDVSAIVDGDLFSLPGGAVKLAAGVEYGEQEFDATLGTIVIGSENSGFAYPGHTISDPALGLVDFELVPALAPSDQVAFSDLNRDVTSVFAELVVPIVGDGNAIPMIQELSVSLSGRYDDYSDFGDTSNPKIGLTWRPADWITVRAAWGESFVAPSLANDETAKLSSASAVNGRVPGLEFLLPPPELIASGELPPVTGAGTVIVVQGNAPDIVPQTAETTSIGFDIEPPAVENLRLSLTWWDIEFAGLIDIPGFTSRESSWTTFRSFKTVYPSQAEIDALLASVDKVGLGSSTAEGDVYSITDVRINNTGNFKTDGLDIGGSYLRDFSFGSVDFDLNASYILNREQSGSADSPYTNALANDYSRLRLTTSVGTNVGKLRAQANLRYTAGYDLSSPVGAPPQDEVDSFTTLDLFFRYDFDGTGLLENLSLSLNVNNALDEDPPEYRTANTLVLQQNGFINGGTVGRLVQLGFKKKF